MAEVLEGVAGAVAEAAAVVETMVEVVEVFSVEGASVDEVAGCLAMVVKLEGAGAALVAAGADAEAEADGEEDEPEAPSQTAGPGKG